ncbi:hypothetical protein BGAL_0304g00180 [Botrytis galanthina]|uniref:Fe2OG dioxygenase domain-containing protein n=1 Tax=Botrytis galanthina TaxID=278940 RepID=A0A4V4HU03_9HELO|nr:hypothetical protein BGAL_0304g00180 [Botrytis galanthina]
MSSKSCTGLAEEELLHELEKAVDISESANYCCGGSIPIAAPDDSSSNQKESTEGKSSLFSPDLTLLISRQNFDQSFQQQVPPIVLRWDPKPGNVCEKIVFPVSTTSKSMEALLQTCVPASFGLGGKNVLDETYRKASKLDRSQFSIDFHPHDYGILDVIAQTLLQDVSQTDFLRNRGDHRGVLAELYKLNIYSGPSGKFKAHVDTPRGGQLRVTHRGSNTFFDWGNKSDSIQWAAFYSDCEHEVLEVTSGHRVTLTYNLYISQKIGIPLQKNLVADPTLSPLYEVARNVLVQPGFMKRGIVDVLLGGVIGFYCDHLYAHTQDDTDDIMPYALKGIDMTNFNTFQSLGLVVKACPVLCMDDYFEDEEEHITRAGTRFHRVEESAFNEEYKDDVRRYLKLEWTHKKYENVAWLNGSGSTSIPAFYGLAYGNESSIMCFHSKAGILIEVPAYDERMAKDLA